MKNKELITFLLFTFNFLSAQNWVKFDTLFSNAVTSFYSDSIENSIYIGGQFRRVGNNDTMVGICKYKNGNFIRLGDGVDWSKSLPWCATCIPNPVNSIIKFKDTIYITGGFTFSGSRILNGIAKWNGTGWKNIGTGLKNSGQPPGGTSGVGYKFKIIDNELYLAGGFDSINGVLAHGLAKFNGVSWTNVKNIPVMDPQPGSGNLIYDVEKYKNEIFVAGIFYDNSNIRGIAKWNGTAWVSPGIGIYGIGNFRGLTTYKDKLYLLGAFSNTMDNPNDPGDCIISYDGSNWNGKGKGIISTTSLGYINAYKEYKGTLFLGGGFDKCNGNKINGIASFDGEYFCSLDTLIDFNAGIYSIDVYKDTLFIGGYLQNSGKPLHSIAKCIDHSVRLNCSSSILSLSEHLKEGMDFVIAPNPNNGKFTIKSAKTVVAGYSVEIYDFQGQKIFQSTMPIGLDATCLLNISYFYEGLYFVKIIGNGFTQTGKVIIQK